MNDPSAIFKVPPVVKTIEVGCTPARAFEIFTQEIGKWWPLATHSVGGKDAKTCAIEPWVGGRIFETSASGEECAWGHILEWSPPSNFAMTWHPGRGPDSAQRVRLTFDRAALGARVTLVHDGWETLGEDAQAMRDNYDKGWEGVFKRSFKDATTTLA